MLFCQIYIGSFAHERVGHMAMYFPRYLIGSTFAACFAVVIKYLRKYITMCLSLSCVEGAMYMRQNRILIFYINAF